MARYKFIVVITVEDDDNEGYEFMHDVLAQDMETFSNEYGYDWYINDEVSGIE